MVVAAITQVSRTNLALLCLPCFHSPFLFASSYIHRHCLLSARFHFSLKSLIALAFRTQAVFVHPSTH
jgi:hypothetical protein